MWWSKRLVAAAAWLGLQLMANRGQAEEKARLVYSRSPGTSCPAEIELRLSIVARLGYDPFSPQASRVVLARIERRAHRLIGVVELVDREGSSSGRRELYAARGRCAELARALALSISLTIDAERAQARLVHDEPGDADIAVSRPRAQEIEPEPLPASTALPTQSARLFSGAMLVAAQGSLPGFALGGHAYVGMGWHRESLRLEARFMQSFQRDLPEGSTIDGRTLDPGVAACRSWDRIEACVVGQLGILRVRSHGERNPRTVTETHGQLGPRFLLYFPGPIVSLVIGAEGLFNLSFNDVRMHRREVWRSPLFSGSMLIGLEANFL